jgi:hypothetical protein
MNVTAIKDALRVGVRGAIGDGMVGDAIATTGLAFLRGELEKRDPKLLEPLNNVSYFKDINVVPGGGFVDYTSNVFVDYASVGGNYGGVNDYGIQGGQTNGIPMIQANLSKDVYKVLTWGNNMKVSFVDNEKYMNTGATKSLDQMFNDGVRLNFNKALDQNAYLGFANYGTYGLVNQTTVYAYDVDTNAAASSTLWSNKTAIEILKDVNALINNAYIACEYDESAVIDHILIPPAQFAYIQITPVTLAGSESILSYILRNNLAENFGKHLTIRPSRWCIGAGGASDSAGVEGGAAADRMVGYCMDEKYLNFDLTVPCTRIMTAPDVGQQAYLTAFAGQIGQVKALFPTTMRYADGI